MKVLFNVICLIGALLIVVSFVHSLTTSEPWPNETRNTVLFAAFWGALWYGVNRFWNAGR